MANNTFLCGTDSANLDISDLMNNLPFAAGIKNDKFQYIGINHKAALLAGYSLPEEMLGITDNELKCDATSLGDVFRQQDSRVLQGQDLTTLDISKYADGEIHIFLSTKKQFKNKAQESCLIFTMTELPIRTIARIFTELSYTEIHQNSDNILSSYEVIDSSKNSELPPLTNRQNEMLFFLLRGKSAKEIADNLHLSARTVEDHITSLKDKFGCYTKSELIDRAFQLGFGLTIPVSLLTV